MLILTRGKQQSIRIGGVVTVTVIEVRPNGTVRIGIDAPKEINIVRTEIENRKEANEHSN